MNSFTTLLHKDLRVYRIAIYGTVVLGVTVYILYLLAAVISSMQYENHRFITSLPDGISAAGGCAVLVTSVMAAVFGGMAFAEERRERWADFVTLLPPRRDHAVASKLVVSLVFLSACVCVHVFIAFAANTYSNHSTANDFGEIMTVFVASGVMMFGVGWGLSCRLSSSAISASVAIVAVLSLALFTQTALQVSYDERGQWFAAVFPVAAVLAGIVAWALGTNHYLHRIEP